MSRLKAALRLAWGGVPRSMLSARAGPVVWITVSHGVLNTLWLGEIHLETRGRRAGVAPRARQVTVPRPSAAPSNGAYGSAILRSSRELRACSQATLMRRVLAHVCPHLSHRNVLIPWDRLSSSLQSVFGAVQLGHEHLAERLTPVDRGFGSIPHNRVVSGLTDSDRCARGA